MTSFAVTHDSQRVLRSKAAICQSVTKFKHLFSQCLWPSVPHSFMLKIRYFCFYWAFRWYITGSFVTQILITTQTSYHGFVGDLRVQTEDYKQDVHFLIWCSLQYVQTMGWYVHIRRRKRFSTPVVKVQSWLDGFYCAFDCSVCICMWNGTLCAHPPFPPLPLSPSPPSCAPPPPPPSPLRDSGVFCQFTYTCMIIMG